jgi:hypothetical protein
MIGRRAIAGLSLPSALLFCAFAAQSALATETKPANTTAFTCVASGGETTKDFKDAHCDEAITAGTGSFEHLKIAKNVKTQFKATNEKVTEKTTKSEPLVLKFEVPGGKVTITCTTVKNNEAESFVENSEPEAGVHRLKGTLRMEVSNCTATELAKCVVAEPIITMFNLEGVQEFKRNGVNVKGPKGEEKPMGIKFTGEGAEETFAEIEFKNKGAESCSLNGKIFKCKGSMIATSGPTTESKQDNKWGGATWVFTPKFEMQTLKCGANNLELSTILTPTMAGIGGNPLSTTTQ